MSANNPNVRDFSKSDTQDTRAKNGGPNSIDGNCFLGDSLKPSGHRQGVIPTESPHLTTTRQSDTLAHSKLNDEHDTPDRQSTRLPEPQGVDASHGLSIGRGEMVIDIGSHTSH